MNNGHPVRERDRPKTKLVKPARAAAKSIKEGEERNMILAKTDLVQKMKKVAYWDRLPIKEVFEEAIVDRIKKYEKKSGPLKPVPTKR